MTRAEGYSINAQCDVCQTLETFFGFTKRDAYAEARKGGWKLTGYGADEHDLCRSCLKLSRARVAS